MDQKRLIWMFLVCNLKIILLYLKLAPLNLPKDKVWCKNEKTLESKMLYLSIFGLEFENAIVIIEISNPKLV